MTSYDHKKEIIIVKSLSRIKKENIKEPHRF